MTPFAWTRTARRQRRSTLVSLAIALVATIAIGLLPAIELPRIVEIFRGSTAPRASATTERIGFVSMTTPAHGGDQPSAIDRVATTAPSSAVVVPVTRAGIDSASAPALAPGDDRDPGLKASLAPGARSYTPQPITAPALGAFPGTRTFTAEQKDSALWHFALSVPHAPWVPPTQAQRDSMMRSEAMRWATARDQGRPVAIDPRAFGFRGERESESGKRASSTGGSFRLPLFSPGPSRAEPKRDSAINAGNLRRLAKLSERARAKRDSARIADSIALLTKP